MKTWLAIWAVMLLGACPAALGQEADGPRGPIADELESADPHVRALAAAAVEVAGKEVLHRLDYVPFESAAAGFRCRIPAGWKAIVEGKAGDRSIVVTFSSAAAGRSFLVELDRTGSGVPARLMGLVSPLDAAVARVNAQGLRPRRQKPLPPVEVAGRSAWRTTIFDDGPPAGERDHVLFDDSRPGDRAVRLIVHLAPKRGSQDGDGLKTHAGSFDVLLRSFELLAPTATADPSPPAPPVEREAVADAKALLELAAETALAAKLIEPACKVAGLQAKAGDRESAAATLARALALANQSAALMSKGLGDDGAFIATGLADIDAIDEARAVLQKLDASVKWRRPWAEWALVKALTRAGKIADARALAEGITDDGWRANGLVTVAQALARAGDLDAALAIEKMLPPSYQGSCRSIVIDVRARAGELAQATDLALAANPDGRYLGSVVAAHARRGDFPAALRTIERIRDDQWRPEALRTVAGAQLRAGSRDAARETFRKVNEALARLVTPTAVHSIAEDLLDGRGDPVTAREAAEMVVRRKATIDNAWWNSFVGKGAAKIHVALGDFEGAERISLTLSYSHIAQEIRDLIAAVKAARGDASALPPDKTYADDALKHFGRLCARDGKLATVLPWTLRTAPAQRAHVCMAIAEELLRGAGVIKDPE